MHFHVVLLLFFANDSPRPQVDVTMQPVTFNCHDTKIRRALTDLFAKVPISFSIDDKIQATVSAHLASMPWETALQKVLHSCYLDYRSEGGVFEIVQRERSAKEERWIRAHPESEIQTKGLPADRSPVVTLTNERSGEALWGILWKSGANFVIGDPSPTKLIAKLPAQPIGATLGFIALKNHGALRYESGVWIISGPFRGPIVSDGQ